MIKTICDQSKCSGCSACANICPKGAIEMRPGKIGHIYPSISNMCIECGLCIKTCPVNTPVLLQKPQKTLAFWVKDKKEHSSSTSGGAAACFTNYILESGGVVYGCASLPHGVIEHIRITNKNDAYKLKGSKYVHSHINNCFSLIEKDLREGKRVLFIGLPCQVAGLRNFIKKDDNLFSIDLICHGVPSQQVLFDYIESLGFNRNVIDTISFRENKGFYLSIYAEGKNVYHEDECSDLYYMAFNDNLNFRDSCYSCRYSTSERAGDLTIGDFWGLGSKIPFPLKTQGNVSVAFVNTEKGQFILDSCADKYVSIVRTLEEAAEGNHNLRQPSVSHNSEKFASLYGKVNIKTALKKCLWKRRLKAPIVLFVKWIISKR